MRALADDSELARARGIRVEAIISRVWFIVGSYAALGGALIGLETVISLELGYSVILPAFAAAVLGGIGSVHGAMLGALIIGLAENIVLAIDWSFLPFASGPLYIDTGYKLAVAFLVMVAVLILRPRGLFQGTSGD
jgi:branched-subunit amino acid ABC-type transport system permease component